MKNNLVVTLVWMVAVFLPVCENPMRAEPRCRALASALVIHVLTSFEL